MREKELRLALVCYGGISLAVYMHGIVKEVWKLLRASRAVHDRGEAKPRAGLADSETAYAALLDTLAEEVDVRVLVDIVAGASAGGINGIFLAHAIAGGHDMEPLRDLWLDDADVERLLDPDAAPSSRFSKLYARPIVWLAGGRVADVQSIPDPETRDEVTLKLSRFIRSRWFEPPFSGAGFTRVLYRALGAMEAGEAGKPLLPPGQPLDLKVTVTDFRGYGERLAIHSPPEIVETEHRLVVAFRDDGRPAEGAARCIGSRASLAFAARATASFPGAFPPFRVVELDAVLAKAGDSWTDRAAFLARTFPRRADDPEGAVLIDGSVLNNAPFRPAIEALGNRPAHREVDRRFVYIDPKPGGRLIGARGGGDEAPGFFSTILRALSDIPREQPIRDAVEALNARSERIRRLRRIAASMQGEVDRAIESALGITVRSATPARLAEWRDKLQRAAANEAGYAFAAYGHLKLGQVIDWAADTLALAGGHTARGDADAVRAVVWRHADAIGIDTVTSTGRSALPPATIAFLRGFDLPFRVRRLRFVIRRLNEIVAELPAGAARGALDRFKVALYAQLAPFLDRRTPAFLGDRAALPDAMTDPAGALAALERALALTTLDKQADAAFSQALSDRDLDPAHRRALLLAWLGFPFYDIATLPLLQGEGFDEFDAVKVDRISPDDARALHVDGVPTALKGAQFNDFGAFFSRAWREHDYLWGRLHAADRLIDIVASTAPKPPEAWVLTTIKHKAFAAILDAERPHLGHVGPLIDSLRTLSL